MVQNQTARSFRHGQPKGLHTPLQPMRQGSRTHPAREGRKPPSAQPKLPLKTCKVSYFTTGDLSPSDGKQGDMTLLSNGNVIFVSSESYLEFPLSYLRQWLKGKIRDRQQELTLELKYDGSSIYINVGDSAKFSKYCT